MVREIAPAPLAPAALAELKLWLHIERSESDAVLMAALRSALATCEAFTGEVLLLRDFEQLLPITGEWQRLGVWPVAAITDVAGVPAEGAAFPLAPDAYAIDIDGEGNGRVRVHRMGSAGRMRVAYSAGLALHWSGLPEPIRHGITLFAAHAHSDPTVPMPAAVAALWRPWRRMRLA